MTGKEIQNQINYASRIVSQWPEWKRNILTHSSQPTNSLARNPVSNDASVLQESKTDGERV